MPSEDKDYYKTLQVDPTAEPEIIEGAHKRLVRKYHPDTNRSPDATRRMQEINAAYGVLRDPVKRAEYDRKRFPYSSRSDGRNEEGRHKREEAEAVARRAKEETEAAQRRAEEERRKREEAEAPQRHAEEERHKREEAEAARRSAKKEGQERASQPSAKPEKSVIRQYAEAVIIAIILALVIRSFVIQAFKIPSGSMLQTLQIGDHILVNKFLFWFTDPQHGDIIVFKFPQDEGRDFIKRVIALPGEKVEVREKQVYINDKPLTEPYTVHLDPAIIENPGSSRDNFGPVVVAPGQLFMMGDNRDYSMDSRFWGFLDMKKIKGKAFIIYWSWDHERFRPRWERIGMLVR